MRRAVIGIACVCACVSTGMRAAQTTQQPAQQPVATFKAGVAIVTLDVTVLDKDGKPVPGLTASDFEIKLGGKVAPIQTLAFVQSAGAAADVAPAAPAAPAPTKPGVLSQPYADATLGRHTVSNAVSGAAPATPAPVATPVVVSVPTQPPTAREPRVFILLVDDLSYAAGRGRSLFAAARRFVDRVPASDPIGVTTTSGMSILNPTRDRAAISAVLAKVVGQFEDPRSIRPAGGTAASASLGKGSRDQPLGLSEAIDIDRGDDRLLLQVIVRECYDGVATAVGNRSVQQIIASDSCASDVSSEARRTAALMRQVKERQLEGVKGVITAMSKANGIRHLVILTDGVSVSRDVIDLDPVIRAAAATGVQVSMIMEEPDQTMGGSGRRQAETETNYGDGMTSGARAQSDPGMAARVREDNRLLMNGAQTLTDMLGGTFYRVVGTPDPFFDRVLIASSAVYRIGVELPAGLSAGKEVSASAKVNRPGVDARTNKFAITVDPALAAAPPPAAPAPYVAPPVTADDLVVAAIKDGSLQSDVPIRMAAFVRRNAADPKQVDLSVHAAMPAGVKGPAIASIALIDATGAAKSTRRILEAQPDGSYLATYLFPLAPGDYKVRFVAADAAGKLGSVEVAVPATLQRMGAFTASDVLTWYADAGKAQLFTLEDVPAPVATLNASIELYPPAGPMPADAPHVRWTLLKSGQASPVIDEEVAANAGPAFFRGDMSFPISSLPAGSYTIRATVLVNGQPAGTAAATVKKK